MTGDEWADYDRRQAEEYARQEAMCARYPDDIRQLYDVWRAGTGSSDIAGQIIRAAHEKAGRIEVSELRMLDADNLASALRVIGMFGLPGLLSDHGLTLGPKGQPLLTDAEVQNLMDAA